MAAQNWGTNRPLENFLFDEAHLFDFYQAVRLIERLRPSGTPVGEGFDPATEAARFKSKVTLAFPATDVEAIRVSKTGGPPEVVAFEQEQAAYNRKRLEMAISMGGSR